MKIKQSRKKKLDGRMPFHTQINFRIMTGVKVRPDKHRLNDDLGLVNELAAKEPNLVRAF